MDDLYTFSTQYTEGDLPTVIVKHMGNYEKEPGCYNSSNDLVWKSATLSSATRQKVVFGWIDHNNRTNTRYFKIGDKPDIRYIRWRHDGQNYELKPSFTSVKVTAKSYHLM